VLNLHKGARELDISFTYAPKRGETSQTAQTRPVSKKSQNQGHHQTQHTNMSGGRTKRETQAIRPSVRETNASYAITKNHIKGSDQPLKASKIIAHGPQSVRGAGKHTTRYIDCCIRCCVLMSSLGAAMPPDIPGMLIDIDCKLPKLWDMLVGR
jgi:hypothetical protein